MAKRPFIRSPYNYDCEEVSRGTALVCKEDKYVALQSFKEECDINTIVRRFGLTGQLPQAGYKEPLSGDFTGVMDFQTAMNAVRQAQENFMLLPAELRDRFGHDPQKLVRFLENKDNREEAIKLGLVAKPLERTRDVVQAVDELAAKIVPVDKK